MASKNNTQMSESEDTDTGVELSIFRFVMLPVYKLLYSIFPDEPNLFYFNFQSWITQTAMFNLCQVEVFL